MRGRLFALLLLTGSAAGLQSGGAAALQSAGSCSKGAPLLRSGSRHSALLAAARGPHAAAENPARPLQLTAFVFVLGLSLVTLTPAKEVTTRMGTEAGMRLLTLLTTGSAAAEIALSPLVGSLTDSVGRKPVLLATCFSVFAVNLATAVCPTVAAHGTLEARLANPTPTPNPQPLTPNPEPRTLTPNP